MESRLFRGVFAATVCVLVAVTAFADATVTASNAGAVCAGSSIFLYGSSSDPAATYSWTGPNNYSSTDQNPVITNADLNSSGTYTLTSSGMTATTNVVVNPNATISAPAHLTTTDASQATGPDGAASYSWTISGNGTLTGGQNAQIASFTAGAPGTITLTLDTGCSTSSTNVTVDPQPTISINNVSGKTGPKGTTVPFTFTISLSIPSSQTVSVEYYTSNSTAIAGKDYQSTSGTAYFKPGDTAQNVSVNVYGTNTNPQKVFVVPLYEAMNATIKTIYGWPVRGNGIILAK